MFRFRHPAARDHVRNHAEQIHLGVLRLAQGLAIEAEEEAASALPGRVFDGFARSRVRQVLQRRIDDALAWLAELTGGDARYPAFRPAPPQPFDRTVTLETQQFLMQAGVFAGLAWLLVEGGGRAVGWVKSIAGKLPAVLPLPSPTPPVPAAPCVQAAVHFAALRQHFSVTGQTNRVAIMDECLAAGLFSTQDCPAIDASEIVDPSAATIRVVTPEGDR